MQQYRQCRLRRRHQDLKGYAEMVTYLPLRGTNGRSVEVGHVVVLAEDSDHRPWSIVAASDQVVQRGVSSAQT